MSKLIPFTYIGGTNLLSTPMRCISVDSEPTTALRSEPIGSIAIDISAEESYQLVSKAGNSAVWIPLQGANTASRTDITLQAAPVMATAADTGGAPTGTTGALNLMSFQEGVMMQQFILGAGQTIIAPVMEAEGLLISLDLTDNEGAEYNFGTGVGVPAKHRYTIGTSNAFYIEATITAADVGGLDPLLVGFRKEQANQADFTSYTDFAAIGARSTTAADVVVLATDLNNAGEVYTNTTDAWTDGQTKTLRVDVSKSGVVTYKIDGSAPTTTAAFTFDSGDVVCPFIHLLHGASTPGAVHLVSLKVASL